MIGMQAAKLKAESQGRKAKVLFDLGVVMPHLATGPILNAFKSTRVLTSFVLTACQLIP